MGPQPQPLHSATPRLAFGCWRRENLSQRRVPFSLGHPRTLKSYHRLLYSAARVEWHLYSRATCSHNARLGRHRVRRHSADWDSTVEANPPNSLIDSRTTEQVVQPIPSEPPVRYSTHLVLRRCLQPLMPMPPVPRASRTGCRRDEFRSPKARKRILSFRTIESTAGPLLARDARTGTGLASARMLHNGLYS